jgi:putative intracellular protease/amidase
MMHSSFPGGYSPDKLRACDDPVRFVKEFVEDGNIVSSRSPDDLPAFISACLKRL